MAPYLQLLDILKEQSTATVTRTDVLRPLIWPMSFGLVLAAITGLFHGPLLLTILFAVIGGGASVGSFAAYYYALLKNPDLLRSEEYALTKLAIDKGLYGDDKIGLHNIEKSESAQVIDVTPVPADAEPIK